ncbi:MAG: hypothetical protein JJ693_04405 [Acidithiobacillus sp.]|nr:hypothetical protein [Acidithiobacillus sp.]
MKMIVAITAALSFLTASAAFAAEEAPAAGADEMAKPAMEKHEVKKHHVSKHHVKKHHEMKKQEPMKAAEPAAPAAAE